VTPPLVEEESSVEYAGEAVLPPPRRSRGNNDHARPLLRLSGTGRMATVTYVPASSPWASDEISPTAKRGAAVAALRLYRQSLAALRAGHNGVALVGFRKFLTRYPRHDYADNAQYWVGQCYYDLNQFHASAREFRRVVERYPHGNKVPDAMLKLGFSELATGDPREGRRVLESLRRIYPRQAAARLASERLAQVDDHPSVPAVSLEMPRR
jgi:tol-pal system protein YbgF